MKLSILSTLALCITTCSIFSQKEYTTDYEVQYEATYSMDSTNLENKTVETLYLFTGRKYGVFMSYREAFKDEIMADLERQLKSGSITISKEMKSNFPKTFYKDHQNNNVKTSDKIDRKQYHYQEPAIPLDWNIEEDSKEIMGYTTQKATTHFAGRDYTAWFTLEIPIADGPYVFSGLPGLIIELYDAEDHYHFTLKTLAKLEEPRIFEFPKSEEIVKKDFIKLKEKALKNSENNTLNVGNYQIAVGYSGSEMSQESKMQNQEMKRKMKENLAKKNNLIERF